LKQAQETETFFEKDLCRNCAFRRCGLELVFIILLSEELFLRATRLRVLCGFGTEREESEIAAFLPFAVGLKQKCRMLSVVIAWTDSIGFVSAILMALTVVGNRESGDSLCRCCFENS